MWGRYHEEYGMVHNVFTSLHQTIIDKYDWFMVVRNPYNRILSEYHCMWGGIGFKNPHHTKAEMNAYLINKIKNIDINGDHYTEQFRYLHPTTPIQIIKFENLQSEFDELLAKYKIKGVVLLHLNINPKYFELSDFSAELIKLINDVYDKDFTTFGYSKLSV